MYTLNDAVLRKLCQINSYEIPTADLAFFGIRGSLPSGGQYNVFKDSHNLQVTVHDHRTMRCTLGQWKPKEKKIALFMGSTVPHMKYIERAKLKGGLGANMLMTGYYHDYRKGVHNAASNHGHQAFRQEASRPIIRNSDDFDYDANDTVDFMNPNDNLHCGFASGSEPQGKFDSAGCQVVMGFPKRPKIAGTSNTGDWKIFFDNAYAIQQQVFPYILWNGREVNAVAENSAAKHKARLRFGSKGDLVEKLQISLKQFDCYEGSPSGTFDNRTLRGVMDFQRMVFGQGAADGIVGPMTAEAMGMDWPEI